MKFLITGGGGFVGSHLADAFIARGDERQIRAADGRVVWDLDAYAARNLVDYVIAQHEAAGALLDVKRDATVFHSYGEYCVSTGVAMRIQSTGTPSAAATICATVPLPEAEGPSMAITGASGAMAVRARAQRAMPASASKKAGQGNQEGSG